MTEGDASERVRRVMRADCGPGEQRGVPRGFPRPHRTPPFRRGPLGADRRVVEPRDVAGCAVDSPLWVSPCLAPPCCPRSRELAGEGAGRGSQGCQGGAWGGARACGARPGLGTAEQPRARSTRPSLSYGADPDHSPPPCGWSQFTAPLPHPWPLGV